MFHSLAPTQHVVNIAPLEVVPSGLNLIPHLLWALQTIYAGIYMNKLSVPKNSPESWCQLAGISGLLWFADIPCLGNSPSLHKRVLGPQCTWQQFGSPAGAVQVLCLRIPLLLDNMDNCSSGAGGLPKSYLTNTGIALFKASVLSSKEVSKYKSLN